MMHQDENKQLEELANNALDNSIDELSPEVQRRLTSMRIDAARGQQSSQHAFFGSSWKMATAFSFALVAVLSWNLWPTISEAPFAEVAELSPFAEVLQEDLDMLEELEFVYWMSEENKSETATL